MSTWAYNAVTQVFRNFLRLRAIANRPSHMTTVSASLKFYLTHQVVRPRNIGHTYLKQLIVSVIFEICTNYQFQKENKRYEKQGTFPHLHDIIIKFKRHEHLEKLFAFHRAYLPSKILFEMVIN